MGSPRPRRAHQRHPGGLGYTLSPRPEVVADALDGTDLALRLVTFGYRPDGIETLILSA
jgi:hypothetical protein